MADPIKVLSQEITLDSTPNTVSSAKLVRVVNNNTGPVLITQRNSSNAIIGTFTLGKDSSNFCNEFVLKSPTDTLESNAASGVAATSVGKY